MKARPDCIVCLFKQALNTVRLVSEDPDVQLEVMKKVASYVRDASLNQTPAAFSKPAYEFVTEVTGVADPYKKQKVETNRLAAELLPTLKCWVEMSKDPLDMALHVAVAGNIIDFGIGHEFDLERDIKEIIQQDFAINAIEKFRKELGRGKKILYLGDNSGEIVFDQLLVDCLLKTGADVTYTVNTGPIINDATVEDAKQTGMTELVKILETGSNDIGVDWSRISDDFRNAFESADIIVSKGHANFETCNDRPENIYFLLKTKCQIVAQELGVKLGDIVFKSSR